MIILVVLVLSLIIALARGGKLGNLANLNLRWRGVILIGFLIQVLVFSSYWQEKSETRSITQLGYVASLILLLAALIYNYRLPGIPLITLGFFSNFIAIALNGGYMPASRSAMQTAGLPVLLPGQVSSNSIGMGSETVLFFLCDIFAIPRGFIFPNVLSLGDILIALGAVWLIRKALFASPNPQSS